MRTSGRLATAKRRGEDLDHALDRAFAEAQGGTLALGPGPAGGAEATLTLPAAA